jgi:response regulator of citrate/malate metabolism
MSELLIELLAVRKVKVASNYEEAVKIISEQMHDFALLDIHLPGKNGIELLKLIKNSKRPCRVVMVTNQADEYHKNLWRKFGG